MPHSLCPIPYLINLNFIGRFRLILLLILQSFTSRTSIILIKIHKHLCQLLQRKLFPINLSFHISFKHFNVSQTEAKRESCCRCTGDSTADNSTRTRNHFNQISNNTSANSSNPACAANSRQHRRNKALIKGHSKNHCNISNHCRLLPTAAKNCSKQPESAN